MTFEKLLDQYFGNRPLQNHRNSEIKGATYVCPFIVSQTPLDSMLGGAGALQDGI